MLLPLVWFAAAHGASVEALVSVSDDGERLLDARAVPGDPRPPRSGPALPLSLQVVDADGRVVGTAAIPDPRLRTAHTGDDHGHAVVLDQAVARVSLDWPASAVALELGGARLVPRSPPPGDPTAVIESGPSTERLDMVFLGDGYTEAELPDFADDVDRITAYLLSIEPYGAYADLINVWRVDAASVDSGVDHPERSPPVERDTAYGCFYGCGGLDRLLCCDDSAVLTAINDAVPAADGVVVLVNDPQYGGAGGYQYATSYVGPYGDQVAAHEIGHSLVGLGDEYDYGTETSYPARPNCTEDPDDPPWAAWLDEPGVGAVSVCGYRNHHRPTAEGCMMRTLTDDYCVVCRELATLAIYDALPALIAGVSPAEGTLTVTEAVEASVTPLGDDPSRFEAAWTLDGAPWAEGLSVTVPACTAGTLEVTLRDPTPWVRSDPTGALTEARAWTLLPCENIGEDSGGGDTDAEPGGAETGDAGVTPPLSSSAEPAGGCACSSGGAPSALALLLLPAIAVRRRPRRTAPR